MIKAKNGRFEIEGTDQELCIEFIRLLNGMIKEKVITKEIIDKYFAGEYNRFLEIKDRTEIPSTFYEGGVISDTMH